MSTALRWARILRRLGHVLHVDDHYNNEPCDLMIAIHAWRSAASISAYAQQSPEGPLIVALAGTDVNTFLESDPTPTLRSMDAANALVCLNHTITDLLPQRLHQKLNVIYQSAKPLPGPKSYRRNTFDVCVIGHLRVEKDPLRTALAARLAPSKSKLFVRHFGKASTSEWAQMAASEMQMNSRYRWYGDVPGWQVRRELARTRLMVITSNQEGGANVVSEAIAAGVPIIASNIDGNIGLLGAEYPGYFPVQNEQALANILYRAETNPAFMASLQKHVDALSPLFSPECETAAWQSLLADVTGSA